MHSISWWVRTKMDKTSEMNLVPYQKCNTWLGRKATPYSKPTQWKCQQLLTKSYSTFQSFQSVVYTRLLNEFLLMNTKRNIFQRISFNWHDWVNENDISYLLFLMNPSQFPMNSKVFCSCQTNIEYITMALVTAFNAKNDSPYSIIDFASKIRNANVANAKGSKESKKRGLIQLIGCLLWYDSNGEIPNIWWYRWANRNNLIEVAIVTVDRKLISYRLRKE